MNDQDRSPPFWDRVQARLDERADPLEDARVRAELCEQPERFAELERLLARLQALEAAPAPPAVPASPSPLGAPVRMRRTVVLAAAAVLLALPAVLWLRRPGDEAVPVPDPPVATGAAGAAATSGEVTRPPRRHVAAPDRLPDALSKPLIPRGVLRHRVSHIYEGAQGRVEHTLDPRGESLRFVPFESESSPLVSSMASIERYRP
ncbi:MAG: hypothetical protein AAF682_27405 [Planctomycetota bacterium]